MQQHKKQSYFRFQVEKKEEEEEIKRKAVELKNVQWDWEKEAKDIKGFIQTIKLKKRLHQNQILTPKYKRSVTRHPIQVQFIVLVILTYMLMPA